MTPHKKSAPFKKDRDLMGEVVYGREGRPLKTAEFGLKAPEDLKYHDGICNRNTKHAKLHRELYGKCPEEEDGLVAVGYSYQKDIGLVFNSQTFNDISRPYLDKKRYRRGVTNVAGKHAQEQITNCTNAWMEDNCPSDWTYSPQKKRNSSMKVSRR